MDSRNDSVTDTVYRHNLYGNVTDVKLSFVNYMNNGTLALQLLGRSEYAEELEGDIPFEDPYATVTVNLPASAMLAVNEQFVDSNNLPGIGAWLEENGIAQPTGIKTPSGYCIYEAYAFNAPDAILEKTASLRQEAIAREMNRTEMPSRGMKL